MVSVEDGVEDRRTQVELLDELQCDPELDDERRFSRHGSAWPVAGLMRTEAGCWAPTTGRHSLFGIIA